MVLLIFFPLFYFFFSSSLSLSSPLFLGLLGLVFVGGNDKGRLVVKVCLNVLGSSEGRSVVTISLLAYPHYKGRPVVYSVCL